MISSSRDVEVAEEFHTRPFARVYLDSSTPFRRGRYWAERLGFSGSSKTAYFWVYDAHSTEAAQGMAWEMLLAEAEKGYADREEVRFS
ncbi:hypothetical protein [Streptomyces sp. NPDC092370]|uniref:hypothetical protein n=1 Tax=Streptomyces sp. NPDC092370 TaxID=3366016 RepID=UPI0037F2FF6B